MSNVPELQRPWLIAVWPGMGHVAVSAGYYLMSKLGMHQFAELSTEGIFDIDHVEVEAGILHSAKLPRNRFFVWDDPDEKRDIVVFIGEAQPPQGKYDFCRRLVEYAQQLGVERVMTFAAMATNMHPSRQPQVLCAATDQEILDELISHQMVTLESGNISGLNGILLGAAADAGLRGCVLLGEMPHVFAQFPYPRAALVVLEAFTRLAAIELDVIELRQQADAVDARLGELLERFEQSLEGAEPSEPEAYATAGDEERLSPADITRI
ncbi:MAG: PAC2 family protein, partial [Planctomycetales bacterium]|nr:PAC2 family protein [Planctomycetales bacterium]